jgi:hypothetical protein
MSEAASSAMPVPAAPEDPGLPPGVDPGVAHSARVYNYWLGGTVNFAVGRALGDALIAAMPSTRFSARGNRAFLGRAVRHLAAEAGIRQFLDIGAGIPAAGNIHEVAQAVAPEARVAYVDHDPIVLAHASELLAGHPAGSTTFIQADPREPEKILADVRLRGALDLGQSVALMLVAVLHFLSSEDDPQRMVSRWSMRSRQVATSRSRT